MTCPIISPCTGGYTTYYTVHSQTRQQSVTGQVGFIVYARSNSFDTMKSLPVSFFLHLRVYTVSCLIYKKLGRIQNTDSDPYLFWLWSWIQKSIRIRIHLLGFWTFGEKNNLFTKHLVVKYMFVHVSTCTLYIDLLVYA